MREIFGKKLSNYLETSKNIHRTGTMTQVGGDYSWQLCE